MTRQGSLQANTLLQTLATLLMVNSLLLAPTWVLHGGLRPHWFALEAGMVTGLFLLLPRRPWSRALAWGAAGLVGLLAVLEVADTAARLSLARPLNLYLDLRLAGSVSNLLRGALGPIPAILVMVGSAAAMLVAVRVLASLLAGLRARGEGGRRRMVAGAVLLAVSLAAVPGRWLHPAGVVLAVPGVKIVEEQARQLTRMLGERERLAAEMAAAPSSWAGTPGLLEGLGGRDVILAFIESYGMSALDDPRYAPVVGPRLREMAAELEAAGLHLVTGRMVAPSQGGMSWLGHASLLSGLWLDNQLRYDLLLASDRKTLVDDFQAAGYRTAALMPAITLAWPEGERLGYDRIWAFGDIDYQGPPLNWVTMPDQFTWSFLQETVRPWAGPAPLFAELGLISSHAPWTPILPVLEDWEGIGSGAVFQEWAGAGVAPEELWRDTEQVREHYARSVAYAVETMGSWAARHVDDGTLLIALGDHQPAPLITGEDAPRTVPVHVVARDPAVLAPFLEWGFVPGPYPDPEGGAPRMDAFRDWFIRAYSPPPAP